MKKIVFSLIVFWSLSISYAQSDFGLNLNRNILLNKPAFCCPKDGKSNPWQFYGGFGLGWTNNEFYADIKPGILYRLAPKFRIGGNLQFTYLSRKSFGTTSRYYIYGYDLLALFLPVSQMELSADYQHSFVSQNISGNQLSRQVKAFFVGAAYRTRHVAIGMKYDLLYDENNSLYNSPFIPFVRIYF